MGERSSHDVATLVQRLQDRREAVMAGCQTALENAGLTTYRYLTPQARRQLVAQHVDVLLARLADVARPFDPEEARAQGLIFVEGGFSDNRTPAILREFWCAQMELAEHPELLVWINRYLDVFAEGFQHGKERIILNQQEKLRVALEEALAVAHAREQQLTTELQERLVEMETLNRLQTGQAWERFAAQGLLSREFTWVSPTPAGAPSPSAGERVVIPLTLRGQQIAEVEVERDLASPWSEEDAALVKILSPQLAQALDGARLFEEAQRRSAEMEALYDISLRFGKNLEMEAIQELLVNQARNLLSADAGGFLTYREQGHTLDFSTVVGSLHAPQWRAKPGEGLVGQVFQEAKTIRIDDYAAWAEHGEEVAEGALAVQAALAVPLSVSWGVAGVLLALRERGKPPFAQADVRLAELLAAQAAVALESARLYQESAKRARDLQQLYDAGLALVSLLDVDEVLNTGADWARRLFDGETATIFYWDEALGQYRAGRAAVSPQWELAFSMPRPGEITHTIRETGKPVLIYDDRITGQNPAALIELGLISQIGVPLRLGQQVVGAAYVHSAEAGHFREEDLHLLEFLGTQLASAIQNASLFGQTQAALGVVEMQVHYQTNVAQATALLAEQGTQALGEVLALLGDATNASRVFCFETQEDAEGLYWDLTSEWTAQGVGSKLENIPALRPEQFPEWLTKFKESGMVQTLLSSASPVERQLLEALGVQSLLLVAVAGNHPTVPGFVGILDLEQEREWAEEVRVVMQTVGAALSSTLAREWLFKQVQDALTETEVLYKTGAALNTAQSYDDILAALCSHTILGQGAHDVTIEFYDRPWTETERPEWIEVLARRGQLPPEKARQRYHVDKTDTVLFPDQVGVVEDVPNDSRLDSRTRNFFFKHLGARSAVFVPLLVGGQRIGTVIALYPEPTTVSEVEQRRLMNLAAQAAVAIQNRYQLQATAARARREQLAREIIGRIQGAADVQGVLQTAARELGRALRTPHTSIQVGGVGERRGRKLGTGMLVSEPDESSPVVSLDE